MKVKSESEVAQSFPTLINPKDCSLRGSSVHGIFQTRALEWGAVSDNALELHSNHPRWQDILLFMAEKYSHTHTSHIVFICSSTDAHLGSSLGCFHVFAIVSKAAVNMEYRCLFKIVISFPLEE